MGEERLDKLIASAAGLTRSQARRLVKIGQVTVNGTVVRSFGFQADPERDRLTAQGETLFYQKHSYLMLNKPQGVISASDGKHYPVVVDLVPPQWRRPGLFPAGRLDKDTTGFVLLTDDGVFAHDILSPKRHVPKTYVASLDAPVTQEMAERFRQGVVTEAGAQFLSAALRPLCDDCMQAEIVIYEGKYHQIKRMFAACGCHVLSLHRTKIGGLALDPALEPGACRPLLPDELKKIENYM